MKSLMLKNTCLYFSALMFSHGVQAESIQADRPGFSTGTYTVEPGMVHLEVGLQSSYGNNPGDADSYTAPLLNLRVGLTSSTELNILVDGVSRERVDGETTSSTSDMLVGFKQRLVKQDKYSFSLLAFVSLPTGTATDSDYTSPFLGLLWDREISEQVSAFGTLQFVSFVEDGERSNNFQPAIGLSFSHSDKISTFIEYYRDASLNISGPALDVFDAGVAYLLTNDTQLDFNFGISIDRDSDDYVGVGYAVRF